MISEIVTHMKTYTFFLAFLLYLYCGSILAAENPFSTPVTKSMIENRMLTEYFDGVKQRLFIQRGIEHVLATQTTNPGYNGVEFGKSKNPGVRHLCIGLSEQVAVGTMLVRGIGIPSVLSTDLPENSIDPTNEKQWITGKRLVGNEFVDSEDSLDRLSYSVWIFPENTKSSTIRFTHTAKGADKTYAGWLGGIYILSERFVNPTSRGVAFTKSQPQYVSRIIDGSNNDFHTTWDNGPQGAEFVVSKDRPEYVSVVWEQPVQLRGLCTLWTGFTDADAEIYVGDPKKHPNESTDPNDWQMVASRTELPNGYVPSLLPNWFDFGKTVSTRAVRLKIMGATKEDHEHLEKKTQHGKRIWLGELLCFMPLNQNQDPLAVLPPKQTTEHPPLPIRFTLPEDGLVSLVLEKEDGTRVRNIVSETPFKKGENIVYWDGSDDLQRDNEAAKHGIYSIPKRLIEPGSYTVRGLMRKPLELRYEFSVYNEGKPPWPTADQTGGWLTNHTPPGCAIWVPGEESATGSPLVYLGSYVSEGGHGLAWFEVDSDEPFSVTKKGGVGWVGGNWTGAQHLARDLGEKRNRDILIYVASVWGTSASNEEKGQDGEVRVSAMKKDGSTKVVKYRFKPLENANHENEWEPYLGGMAVYDGVVAVSLTKMNQIVFLEAETGKILNTVDWTDPRGLYYDANGDLFLLSEQSLFHWKNGELPKQQSGNTATLITGLDSPKNLTIDQLGNIYVSERGKSHHVRVFDKSGKFLRVVGKTGTLAAGPYDELRMNNPSGITVDGKNRLWVTETDFQPKRVSVWDSTGKLIRAFYGPAEYGGGGKLDPQDPTRFYYHGMEFKLDWDKGTFKPVRVYYRPESDKLGLPDGWGTQGFPETPLYIKNADGKADRFFTNCFNNNPTGGTPLACVWFDDPKTGILRPVAAFGATYNWSIFNKDEFRAKLPEGIGPTDDRRRNQCRFLWSDLNTDGQMQPEEVEFEVGGVGGITVGVDGNRIHFVATRITDSKDNNDKTPTSTVMYQAKRNASQTPTFSFVERKVLATEVQGPRSSGGDQALVDSINGRTVLTLGVGSFAPESVCGVKDGRPVWSYPNPWPGLHASHESPAPNEPGRLIGITRFLGDFVQGPYPCPIFAMNGNQGNIYLMTTDGIFVAELFHDVRLAPTWSMPQAHRNMDVGGLTLHDENFWPSITQTKDGNVFLVDGANSALVRIDGLDTIREIAPFKIELSKNDMESASNWLVESEQRRQGNVGQPSLRVPIRKESEAVKIDGSLDDWPGADWGVVDRSGVAAYFDSNSKPYDITATVCVSNDRLVAAFRTNQKDLLRNSGELPQALFKNGGCLDLMIGSGKDADPNRRDPVEGDARFLITIVAGKPKAVLYRPVVPGTATPVPFSSPWRTISIDRVDDITDKIEFASGENGEYEIAVPLTLLGLQPKPGMTIKGDMGILRGNGFATLARVYWSNKSTAITSDVPSEAQLTPTLWGNWLFE